MVELNPQSRNLILPPGINQSEGLINTGRGLVNQTHTTDLFLQDFEQDKNFIEQLLQENGIGNLDPNDIPNIKENIIENGTNAGIDEYIKYFYLTGNYHAVSLLLKGKQGLLKEDERRLVEIYTLFPHEEDRLKAQELAVKGFSLTDYRKDPDTLPPTLNHLKETLDEKISAYVQAQKEREKTKTIENVYFESIEKLKKGAELTKEELLAVSKYLKKDDEALSGILRKKANEESLSKKESAIFTAFTAIPESRKKEVRDLYTQFILNPFKLSEGDQKTLHVHFKNLASNISNDRSKYAGLLPVLNEYKKNRESLVEEKTGRALTYQDKDALHKIAVENAELIPDKKVRDNELGKAYVIKEKGIGFYFNHLPAYLSDVNSTQKQVEEKFKNIQERITKLEKEKSETGQVNLAELQKLKKEISELLKEIERKNVYFTTGKRTSLEDIKHSESSELTQSLQKNGITNPETQKKLVDIFQHFIRFKSLDNPKDREELKADINKIGIEDPKKIVFGLVTTRINAFKNQVNNPRLVSNKDSKIFELQEFSCGRTRELLEDFNKKKFALSNLNESLDKLREKSVKDIFKEWGISDKNIETLLTVIEAQNVFGTNSLPDFQNNLLQIGKNISILNSLSPEDREKIIGHPYPINGEYIAVQIIQGIFIKSDNAFLMEDLSSKLNKQKETYLEEAKNKTTRLVELNNRYQTELSELVKATKEGIPVIASYLEFAFDNDEVLNKAQEDSVNRLKRLRGEIEEKKKEISELFVKAAQLEMLSVKSSVIDLTNHGHFEARDMQLMDLFLKHGQGLKNIDSDLYNEVFKISENPLEMGLLQRLEKEGLISSGFIRATSSSTAQGDFYFALENLKGLKNSKSDLDRKVNLSVSLHAIDNDKDLSQAYSVISAINNTVPELTKLLEATKAGTGLDALVKYMEERAVTLNKAFEELDLEGLKKKRDELKEFIESSKDSQASKELQSRVKAYDLVIETLEKKEVREVVDFIRDKSKFTTNDWKGWWATKGPEDIAKLVVATAVTAAVTTLLAPLIPFALVAGIAVGTVAGIGTAEATKEIRYQLNDRNSDGLTWNTRARSLEWVNKHITNPKEKESFLEITASFGKDVVLSHGQETLYEFASNLAVMKLSQPLSAIIGKTFSKILSSEAGKKHLPTILKFTSFLNQVKELPIEDKLKESLSRNMFKRMFGEVLDEMEDEIKEKFVELALKEGVIRGIANVDSEDSNELVKFALQVVVVSLAGSYKHIRLKESFSKADLVDHFKQNGFQVELNETENILHLTDYWGRSIQFKLNVSNPNDVKLSELISDPNANTSSIPISNFVNSLPTATSTEITDDEAYKKLQDTTIEVTDELHEGVSAETVSEKDLASGKTIKTIKISTEVNELLNSEVKADRTRGLEILFEEITHAHQSVLNPNDYKSQHAGNNEKAKAHYMVDRMKKEIGGESAGSKKTGGMPSNGIKEFFRVNRTLLDSGDYEAFIERAKEQNIITEKDAKRFEENFNQDTSSGKIIESYFSAANLVEESTLIPGVHRNRPVPGSNNHETHQPTNRINGRHIIGRDRPISGGAYPGGGSQPRELLIVDFNKDRELKTFYEGIRSNLRDAIKAEDIKSTNDVLTFVTQKVREQFTNNRSRNINTFVRNEDLINKEVPIGLFIKNGIGVCRHQALTLGAVLERLSSEGVIKGKVSIERSTEVGKGTHVWVRFIKHDGEIIVCDSMNPNHLVGPAEWTEFNDYRRPEEGGDGYWDRTKYAERNLRNGVAVISNFIRGLPAIVKARIENDNAYKSLDKYTMVLVDENLDTDAETVLEKDLASGKTIKTIKISTEVNKLLNSANEFERNKGLEILFEEITHAHQSVLNPNDYKSQHAGNNKKAKAHYMVDRMKREIGGESAGSKKTGGMPSNGIKEFFRVNRTLLDSGDYEAFIERAKEQNIITEKDAKRFEENFNQDTSSGKIIESYFAFMVLSRDGVDVGFQSFANNYLKELIQDVNNGKQTILDFKNNLLELKNMICNQGQLKALDKAIDDCLGEDISSEAKEILINLQDKLSKVKQNVREGNKTLEGLLSDVTIEIEGSKPTKRDYQKEKEEFLRKFSTDLEAAIQQKDIANITSLVRESISIAINNDNGDEAIQLAENIALKQETTIKIAIRNGIRQAVTKETYVPPNGYEHLGNSQQNGNGQTPGHRRIDPSHSKPSPNGASKPQGTVKPSENTPPKSQTPTPEQLEAKKQMEEKNRANVLNSFLDEYIQDLISYASEPDMTVASFNQRINFTNQITKLETVGIDTKEAGKHIRERLYRMALDSNSSVESVILASELLGVDSGGRVNFGSIFKASIVSRIQVEYDTKGSISDNSKNLIAYFQLHSECKDYLPVQAKLTPPTPIKPPLQSQPSTPAKPPTPDAKASTTKPPSPDPKASTTKPPTSEAKRTPAKTPTPEAKPAPPKTPAKPPAQPRTPVSTEAKPQEKSKDVKAEAIKEIKTEIDKAINSKDIEQIKFALSLYVEVSKNVGIESEFHDYLLGKIDPNNPTLNTLIENIIDGKDITASSEKEETIDSITPRPNQGVTVSQTSGYEIAPSNLNDLTIAETANFLLLKIQEARGIKTDDEKTTITILNALMLGNSFTTAVHNPRFGNMTDIERAKDTLRNVLQAHNIDPEFINILNPIEIKPLEIPTQIKDIVDKISDRAVQERVVNVFNVLSKNADAGEIRNIKDLLNPLSPDFENNLAYFERLKLILERDIKLPERFFVDPETLTDIEKETLTGIETMMRNKEPSTEINGYVTYNLCENKEYKKLADDYTGSLKNNQSISRTNSNYATKASVVELLEKRDPTIENSPNERPKTKDGDIKDYIRNLIILNNNNVTYVDRHFDTVFHPKLEKGPDGNPISFVKLASGFFYEAKMAVQMINSGRHVFAVSIKNHTELQNILKKVKEKYPGIEFNDVKSTGNFDTELDILYVHDGKIFIVEAKTSSFAAQIKQNTDQDKNQNKIAGTYGICRTKLVNGTETIEYEPNED